MYVVADNGEWVHADFERLARIISDYNPNFELQWIPPKSRTDPMDHKNPYRVWHKKQKYFIISFGEGTSPESVLAQIFQTDLSKHSKDDVYNFLTSQRLAAELVRAKREEDELEQATDEARFLIESEKHTVRFNGKKFDHQRRVIGPAVDRSYLV